LQNWPVITSVTPHPDSVTVAGVIDTKPATRVDIDVSQLAACGPSGFGEIGPRHGGTTVTTNGSGHANFSMTLPTTDFDGTWWSAIATTSDGTSEAGACVRSPGAQLIAYVTRVYEQLLGREPDPSGLRYWYGLLVGGLPRFTFVNALEHLPEFAGLFVDQQYLTILDRPAEPAGREYWSEYIQHGGTADDLRSLLYGSSEYAATHDAGTNSAYVDALYHDILGRSPDSSGLAYWTDLLNRGVSRVTVARAMLSLPEPIAVAIGRLYQTYLGRPATAADQTYWSDVWRQYGELTVLAMIVSSDEYYASTPF
jgi:hypothetical protein